MSGILVGFVILVGQIYGMGFENDFSLPDFIFGPFNYLNNINKHLETILHIQVPSQEPKSTKIGPLDQNFSTSELH